MLFLLKRKVKYFCFVVTDKYCRWYLVVIVLLYIGLLTSFSLNVSLLIRKDPGSSPREDISSHIPSSTGTSDLIPSSTGTADLRYS